MKNRIRDLALLHLSVVFLFALLTAATAHSQPQEITTWERVTPTDDKFTVLMPQLPIVTMVKKQNAKLSIEARLYTVKSPKNDLYTIWSFTDPSHSNSRADELDDYLDSCADLIWDELVKPGLDNASRDPRPYGMFYIRNLQAPTPIPGREYLIVMGSKRGEVHMYYADSRVYIVMGVSIHPEEMEGVRHFVNSFTITTPPVLSLKTDQSTAPTESQPASAQALSPREVTQRVRILSRPEPQYTETARRYQVSGTVVLKAVCSADGQVTNIRAVNRLPHGLTRASIEAARQIKFQPALKEGQPVSQYIQIEYNYNLY